jgi:hypothetical protein
MIAATGTAVRHWPTLVLAGCALLLAACATKVAGEGAPAMSPPSVSKEDCIYSRLISDWSSLDSQRLIVYGSNRSQPYLMKLSFPSNDLSFNIALRVLDADHNNRICGYGFDAILIPNGIPPRITISSVQKLTKEEAAKLIEEARPKKKTKDSATQPKSDSTGN